MILINLAILGVIAGLVWWLMGNDKNISGESSIWRGRTTAAQNREGTAGQGCCGSAIELLEQMISAQPGNLDLRLQLAEVQAGRCHNIPRVEKIIRQLELSPHFDPTQTATAQARLKEWREARLQRK